MRDELSKAASRSSYVIWINKDTPDMYKMPLIFCNIPTNMHVRTVPESPAILEFVIEEIYPPKRKPDAKGQLPDPPKSDISPFPKTPNPSSDNNDIRLSKSRLTDKDLLLIPIFDPANVLLFISRKRNISCSEGDVCGC